MAIKKSSNLMTTGGILAAFGITLAGSPVVIINYMAIIVKDGLPHWCLVTFLIMIIVGVVLAALGTAIMGVAGKGQDDVPTAPQVDAATAKAIADNLQQKAADPTKDQSLGAPPTKS